MKPPRAPKFLYIVLHEDGSRCTWRGGISDTGVAESLGEARQASLVNPHCPGGKHTIVRYEMGRS